MNINYFDEFNMPQKKMTVAQRKEQIKQLIKELKAAGQDIEPITLNGKKIAKSFWGKAWCDNLDNIAEYFSRLKVARNYLRHGAVIDLKINKNEVSALVSGSDLYLLKIIFQPLDKYQLAEFKEEINKNISSAIDLLNGNFSDEVMNVICDEDYGIFPTEKDLIINCNCPDYTDICKHVAAVMYAIGIKLDDNPEYFFSLRGVELKDCFSINNLIDNNNNEDITTKSLSIDDAMEMFDIDFE